MRKIESSVMLYELLHCVARTKDGYPDCEMQVSSEKGSS